MAVTGYDYVKKRNELLHRFGGLWNLQCRDKYRYRGVKHKITSYTTIVPTS